VSGALGNVWGYDFRDYEVVYYCVVCGVVRGGEEAVICYDKSVVIEEI